MERESKSGDRGRGKGVPTSEDMEGVPVSLGRGTFGGRGKGFQVHANRPGRRDKQNTVSDGEATPSYSMNLRDLKESLEIESEPKPSSSNAVVPQTSDSEVPSGKALGAGESFVTNFVRLNKISDASVFEYNVSFAPPLEQSKTRKKLLKELEDVIGRVHNYDGDQLFLPIKLEENTYVLECNHPTNEDMTVEVTIKFMKENTDHDMCHFYEFLLARAMAALGYEQFRGGFYENGTVRQLPQYKLQVWPGVSFSVECTKDGLMAMFETPRRIIRSDTVYDLYHQLLGEGHVQESLRRTFTDAVLGRIVVCSYNGKCYKIDDIDWEKTLSSQFSFKGKMVTFKEYFFLKHGKTVNNVNQPLLLSKVRGKQSPNLAVGSDNVRVVALVPELVSFAGVSYEERTNPKFMVEINALTRQIPLLRTNLMTDLVLNIMTDEKACTILSDWGLAMDVAPVEVNGHVLKPPRLSFHKACDGKSVKPVFINESHKSCFDPVEVQNFSILCTKRDKDKADVFTAHYMESCMVLGIPVRGPPKILVAKDHKPCSFVQQLQKITQDKNQFVVIITPGHQDDLYRAVKVYCNISQPIPSQCIQARTIQNLGFRKIARNVALQINCKLGGAPWALRIPKRKVMFVGVDVGHDPQRKNPSVIAMIASMNDSCTKYHSNCRIQPIHQEVASPVRTMFIHALQNYAQVNGVLPNHVVFFRDGGCAGTFEVLKKYEAEVCDGILQGMKEKYPERSPKDVNFSYLCVSKRIPERIFKKEPDENLSNPASGTVLDGWTLRQACGDFYIVSQHLEVDAVCPTHYTVLYETRPSPPGLLQQLAYAQTFMYFNRAGVIMVPAVVQFAHKLGHACRKLGGMPDRDMLKRLFYV